MMGCQTVAPGIIICTGPAMRETLRLPGPVLWCFACHEHRMHYIVHRVEVEPSYYGPDTDLRCDRCDRTATDFNGERRWHPEATAILDAAQLIEGHSLPCIGECGLPKEQCADFQARRKKATRNLGPGYRATIGAEAASKGAGVKP